MKLTTFLVKKQVSTKTCKRNYFSLNMLYNKHYKHYRIKALMLLMSISYLKLDISSFTFENGN